MEPSEQEIALRQRQFAGRLALSGLAVDTSGMIAAFHDVNVPEVGVRKLRCYACRRTTRRDFLREDLIGGALGGVDHVVIGPPGIVAISTVAADRPVRDDLVRNTSDAQLVSDAAVNRGPVDEVARPSEVPCRVWARVFWGVPDPSRPPHEELAHGSQLVEGQRIREWLHALDANADDPLDATAIDRAWASKPSTRAKVSMSSRSRASFSRL